MVCVLVCVWAWFVSGHGLYLGMVCLGMVCVWAWFVWAWFSTGPWTWLRLLNTATSAEHGYVCWTWLRLLNRATSAEHASRPFLASTYRIRRFVREHALADRPHTCLWLAKTYVIPTGMYGSQVWGTVFLQANREFLARCLRFICIFWRAR